MENRSHTTEIVQKTRLELENGDISAQEIDDAIRVRILVGYSVCTAACLYILNSLMWPQAFRFHPKRLECLMGGPDSIMWERWEWSKDINNEWQDGSPLLAH